MEEKEIVQLEALGKRYPVVKRILDEYNSITQDTSKEFYYTLSNSIREISKMIRDKSIDPDDPYVKAVIKLSESGDKIFNTLSRGKLDSGIDEEEDKSMSYADRVAMKRKGRDD
jgi:hypothetical protein